MPKRRSLAEAFGQPQDQDEEKSRRIEQEKDSPQAPKSKQYGRRAVAGNAQINANVSKQLKSDVRKKLIDEDRTLQELLETLLEQYLDGRAG